ncbi:cathepsin O [Macrotis lagotis]|uniref:cathepsin O n=1 Tax=Macrotis lagotis TaxID=92651 RepID=UPI003D68A7B1
MRLAWLYGEGDKQSKYVGGKHPQSSTVRLQDTDLSNFLRHPFLFVYSLRSGIVSLSTVNTVHGLFLRRRQRRRRRPRPGAAEERGLRAWRGPPALAWLWLLCGCSCGLGSGLPRGGPPGPAAAASPGRPGLLPPEPGAAGAAAFRESIKRHQYLNSFSSSDNTSAIYGINEFSQLFPEEFRAIYLRSKSFPLPLYDAELNMPSIYMPLPIRFDWRDKHVVTKVRNQQMCGGCWAFSVVGGIESAYAIKGEFLEDLSVQQVIDCSYNNFGCNGGSTVNALNWLNKTQVRLVRDSEYSFKAQTGLCHYFSGSHAGVSIKGYSSYDFSDKEDEMAQVLLAYGPLAVIVDAVSWQDYLGGIIQHHCSSGEANHAVLITGFDKTGDTPYWIVRNSWGTSWGEDGYAFVKMGANICACSISIYVYMVFSKSFIGDHHLMLLVYTIFFWFCSSHSSSVHASLSRYCRFSVRCVCVIHRRNIKMNSSLPYIFVFRNPHPAC